MHDTTCSNRRRAFPMTDEPFRSRPVEVERHRDGRIEAAADRIAAEVAVALVYNGLSHVVMMATPADLEDFALGFSLSEGIVSGPAELYGCEPLVRSEGIELHLELAAARFVALKERRRNLTGRTGCGLCGVESLRQAVRPVAPVERRQGFDVAAIRRALAELPRQQPLARETGCTHAAAWVAPSGELQAVREDVGRHVAFDKLIGARARAGLADGFALITSRASYEMVHKAAEVGIEMLVAVSAPTALAVQLADEAGLTLAGFARHDGFVVYSGAERLWA